MYETKVKQIEDVKEIAVDLDKYLLFPRTPSGFYYDEIIELYQFIMSKFDELINNLFLSNSKPDKNEIKKKINEFVDFLIEKAKEDPLYLVVIGEFFVNIDLENLTKEEVFAYIVELLKNFHKNEYFLRNNINIKEYYILNTFIKLNKSNKETIINGLKVIPYIEQRFEKILNMDNETFQKFTIEVSEFYAEFLKVLQSRLRENFTEYELKHLPIIAFLTLESNKIKRTFRKHKKTEGLDEDEIDALRKIENFLKYYRKPNTFFQRLKSIFSRTVDLNEIEHSVIVLEVLDKELISDADHLYLCTNNTDVFYSRYLKINSFSEFIMKKIEFRNNHNTPINRYIISDYLVFGYIDFRGIYNYYEELPIQDLNIINYIKMYYLNINGVKIEIKMYIKNNRVNKIEILKNNKKIFVKELDNNTLPYKLIINELVKIINNIEYLSLKNEKYDFSDNVKIYEDIEYIVTSFGKIFPFSLVNEIQKTLENILDLFKEILYEDGKPKIYDSLNELMIEFNKKCKIDLLPKNLIVLNELIPYEFSIEDFLIYFINLIFIYLRNNCIKNNNQITNELILSKFKEFLNISNLSKIEKIRFTVQIIYFYILLLEKIVNIINNSFNESKLKETFYTQYLDYYKDYFEEKLENLVMEDEALREIFRKNVLPELKKDSRLEKIKNSKYFKRIEKVYNENIAYILFCYLDPIFVFKKDEFERFIRLIKEWREDSENWLTLTRILFYISKRKSYEDILNIEFPIKYYPIYDILIILVSFICFEEGIP